MPSYLHGLIAYALVVFSAYQTLLLVDYVKQILDDSDDPDGQEG